MEANQQLKRGVNEPNKEGFDYAIELAMISALPFSVQAAIELGVFEVIAKAGPPGCEVSASEIASKISATNPDAPALLDRMLRLLACYSVLGCSVKDSDERLYSLTPASMYFVPDHEDGASLGPLIALIHDKVFLGSWTKIKESILEGGVAFDRAHGSHAFEYPRLDPRYNEVFNKAMFHHTNLVIKQVLETYKGFEPLKQLVDVGGGLGQTIKAITSKYPHIKGINFDQPHVIEHAPAYPGVEHVAGDMFQSVPKTDAIFMKWILHDWSDEHCLKLLRNCYNAIPDDGIVIVMDAVAPTAAESTVAAKGTCLTDVVMIPQYNGGKERTQNEFMTLAIGAGFRGIRYECYVCNFWVMEFYK